MIRQLNIKNLALIEDISIEFRPGFTVFTGETGAGKSILIGAIGLLLGERADVDDIRRGSDEAQISATFEFDKLGKALASCLDNHGITIESNILIVRRIINRGGRNRVFVNQIPVMLSTLKQIGAYLIDFHGQHQHQSLLYPHTPRILIDSFPAAAEAKSAFDLHYRSYMNTEKEYEDLKLKAAQLAQRREMLEFQKNEFDALKLQSGEEDMLERQLNLISSVAQRAECITEIQTLLAGNGMSVIHTIASVRKKVEGLAAFDESVSQWIAELDHVLTVFSELEAFCESYMDKSGVSADPVQLEYINSRLAKIQRLKKKYGCNFEGLLQKQQQISDDLNSLENIDSELRTLEKKLADCLNKCQLSAKKLTQARMQAAEGFDLKITKLMEKLGFKGGQWKTVFNELDNISAHGLESVDFMVQTNPGEALMPLAKIASGGELARLMLAIKTVCAEQDDIPVLIFDEIDSGVGGILAIDVAEALKNLSKTHQVLCISHLHQIAVRADHHFRVYKEQCNERTVVRVKYLDATEKVKEIARMLGDDSEIATKHARQLLKPKQ